MKKEYLNSGAYSVEVTLRMQVDVRRDENVTEDELLCECRHSGEMVDWEVTK